MERKTLMRNCYPQKEEVEEIATDILEVIEDVRIIAHEHDLLDTYKMTIFNVVEDLSEKRAKEFYPEGVLRGWTLTFKTLTNRIKNEVLKQVLIAQHGGKNPHIY